MERQLLVSSCWFCSNSSYSYNNVCTTSSPSKCHVVVAVSPSVSLLVNQCKVTKLVPSTVLALSLPPFPPIKVYIFMLPMGWVATSVGWGLKYQYITITKQFVPEEVGKRVDLGCGAVR